MLPSSFNKFAAAFTALRSRSSLQAPSEWCWQLAERRPSGAQRPRRRARWVVPGNCSRERRRGGAPRGRGETKTEIGDSKHHLRKFPKTGVPFSRLLTGSPICTEPSQLPAAHPSVGRPARSSGEPRAASPAGPARPAEPWDTPPPRARLPRLDLPQLAGSPARRGGGRACPRKAALPLVTTAAAARADPARRGSRWWWQLRRLRRRNGRRLPVS